MTFPFSPKDIDEDYGDTDGGGGGGGGVGGMGGGGLPSSGHGVTR